MSTFLRSLYILDISPLSHVGLVKIPICSLSFCPNNSVICLTEAFQFHEDHLLIHDLSAWAIGVLFKKSSPVLMNSRQFSISVLLDLVHLLRSLTHLDLTFVQGDRYGFILILLHADIQLDQHNLLKMFSFFHCMFFGFFVKN